MGVIFQRTICRDSKSEPTLSYFRLLFDFAYPLRSTGGKEKESSVNMIDNSESLNSLASLNPRAFTTGERAVSHIHRY